jgi:hypothetical protein
MKIIQRGKLYVLYDASGMVVIISRDRRACSDMMNSLEMENG